MDCKLKLDCTLTLLNGWW